MLFDDDIIEKIKSGADIPIPKTMKFIRLVRKLVVEVDTAKSTAREAGLQGRTIAPKKKPKTNDEKYGFLVTGACT